MVVDHVLDAADVRFIQQDRDVFPEQVVACIPGHLDEIVVESNEPTVGVELIDTVTDRVTEALTPLERVPAPTALPEAPVSRPRLIARTNGRGHRVG